MNATDYEKQAQGFLDRFAIKFRATLSDSKAAPWNQPGQNECDTVRRQGGHHYRVTLSKADREYYHKSDRVTFDFWSSIADAEKRIETVTPYDVLSCISRGVHCAESFKDFCGEFGESENSIKALQTYRRIKAFSKRLQAFFTSEEIEALGEIR